MNFPIDNLKKAAVVVIISGLLILGITFIAPLLGVIVPLVLGGAAIIIIYLFIKKKF